jgi:hypothetical protein
VTDRTGYAMLISAESPMAAKDTAESKYPSSFREVVSVVLFEPPVQTPAAGSISYDMYNPSTDQVYRTFYAANDEMALDIGTRYREELRAANPGVLVGVRRTVAAPGVRRTVAAPAAQSTGGEFTGQWLIKDAQGREIHRFGGIGNSQSDANRVAMEWLRSNPAQMTDGVEVVPVMR